MEVDQGAPTGPPGRVGPDEQESAPVRRTDPRPAEAEPNTARRPGPARWSGSQLPSSAHQPWPRLPQSATSYGGTSGEAGRQGPAPGLHRSADHLELASQPRSHKPSPRASLLATLNSDRPPIPGREDGGPICAGRRGIRAVYPRPGGAWPVCGGGRYPQQPSWPFRRANRRGTPARPRSYRRGASSTGLFSVFHTA